MNKWTLGQVGKTKPKQSQNKAKTKPISKHLQSPIRLFRLLIDRLCYVYGSNVSFDSAKMAQYKHNWNLKKGGKKKFNLLYFKGLNGSGRLRSLTGTPFAHFNRWNYIYTDYTQ
jgi:hypothetical protein